MAVDIEVWAQEKDAKGAEILGAVVYLQGPKVIRPGGTGFYTGFSPYCQRCEVVSFREKWKWDLP